MSARASGVERRHGPQLGPPPRGFEEVRSPRGVAWLRTALAPALLGAGLGPDDERAFVEADVGGRAPLRVVEVGGRRVLVRPFSHGGLAGQALRCVPGLALGSTFRDARRPFVELALFERLAALGVPVPEVVAARARRAPGGWRLELATVALASAVDLGVWLGRQRAGGVPALAAQRLARAAGAFVAQLHEVGFLHADLQPANLLVVGDPLVARPTLYALDLDRSRFEEALGVDARRANLARLWRHVRRREEVYGASLTRADRARFLAAWAVHAPGDSWRAAWRAIERIEARGRGWHRLGHAVDRLFGARVDTRARADRSDADQAG